MRRALFAREFHSALLPNLVTVGTILATFMVIERIYGLRLGKPEDIREFTNFALLVGLVVSGFIPGKRCFPGELKESRIFFLSSLPISRSWIWLSIVSARLLAALLSFFFAVVLRGPSLVVLDRGLLRLEIGLTTSLIPFAYLFFFSAGTLFALLFRRTLFSYIAGFLAVGILLVETFFSCSYLTILPPTLFSNLTEVPVSIPSPFILAFLSLILASFLIGSWRLFVRGEIGNSKRGTRSQLLFGVTTTAYLCILFCIMASPRLASAGSHWSPKLPRSQTADRGIPYSVSTDGRYLAVSESSTDRPFLFRVSIVETQTGRVLGRSLFEGVNWVYWSNSGDTLNVVALKNSPLDRWGYLTPATVDWVRLSPEAREISRRRLRGAQQVEILAGGHALAVLRSGDHGQVELLDGASGRSSEIARAPLDGGVEVTTDGLGALVYFKNTVSSSKAWIVDSMAHEVRIPQSTLNPSWVLLGEIPKSPSAAQDTLFQTFSKPLSREGTPVRGDLLLPSMYQFWALNAGPKVKGLFFLEEGISGLHALWARPTTPEGRWERLPDLAPSIWRSGNAFDLIPSFIDFPSGVAAFPAMEGDGSFFVYDPRIGVIRKAGRCPRGNQPFLNLSLNRPAGLKGLLIKLSCEDNPYQGQTHYFEYVPGSREVRAIKTVTTQPNFSNLYFDEQGLDIWVTDEEYAWSSAPGRKDLLLWRGQQDPSP